MSCKPDDSGRMHTVDEMDVRETREGVGAGDAREARDAREEMDTRDTVGTMIQWLQVTIWAWSGMDG